MREPLKNNGSRMGCACIEKYQFLNTSSFDYSIGLFSAKMAMRSSRILY